MLQIIESVSKKVKKVTKEKLNHNLLCDGAWQLTDEPFISWGAEGPHPIELPVKLKKTLDLVYQILIQGPLIVKLLHDLNPLE
jgi:hypothetical protein